MATEQREGAAFPAGVALVAGGSGGIGRAVVAALAGAGSDVALTWRSHEAGALEAAEAAEALGVRASAHRLDVGEAGATEALLAELSKAHGRVHTVVNAQGPDLPQPRFADVEAEAWAAVVEGDLRGFYHLAHAAIPHLRAGGGGALIALSSAGVQRYPKGDVLSVAPKAAIEATLRAIAREEGRHQIRANAVAVGVVDAGQFHRGLARGDFPEAWLEAAKRNIALGRFGEARDVAEAVVFLASRRGAYITGQTLVVDGGYAI